MPTQPKDTTAHDGRSTFHESFVYVTADFLLSDDLSVEAKGLAAILAALQAGKGRVRVSQAALAKKCRATDETVARHLRELETFGILKTTRTRGPSLYELSLAPKQRLDLPATPGSSGIQLPALAGKLEPFLSACAEKLTPEAPGYGGNYIQQEDDNNRNITTSVAAFEDSYGDEIRYEELLADPVRLEAALRADDRLRRLDKHAVETCIESSLADPIAAVAFLRETARLAEDRERAAALRTSEDELRHRLGGVDNLSATSIDALLRDHEPAAIADQLDWLPERNPQNPAAMLVQALRCDWEPVVRRPLRGGRHGRSDRTNGPGRS